MPLIMPVHATVNAILAISSVDYRHLSMYSLTHLWEYGGALCPFMTSMTSMTAFMMVLSPYDGFMISNLDGVLTLAFSLWRSHDLQ